MDEQPTCATALVEDADKNNVELAKIASELDKEVSNKRAQRCQGWVGVLSS